MTGDRSPGPDDTAFGYGDPGYRDPRHGGLSYPPPYLPGQEPLPPRPRKRRTPVIAPVLALMGLVLVAVVSFWGISFLNSRLGDAAAAEPDATPALDELVDATVAPDLTLDTDADPSDTDDPALVPTSPPVVAPPSSERADVKGTILFGRGDDIWSVSGQQLQRLTVRDPSGADSSPVWSANGKHVFFIRTTRRTVTDGKARYKGKYTFYVTDVLRMKPDGRDKKRIYNALVRDSRGLWFSHVLQPYASPDGKTLAVVSDGPDGEGAVVLHVLNIGTGKLRKVANAPSAGDFGHGNPAFNSDGTKIAFTYNDANGTEGDPRIAIHTCASSGNCSLGKTKLLKSGFASPSWSPDDTWLAVEATSGEGRDIAIITANRGDVRVMLTNDGDSFAPTVSPAGDQIAYLRRDGIDIDLRVMTLEFDERGKISLVDDRAVTRDGGLDGSSRPSWYIPPGELAARELEEEAPAEPSSAGGDEDAPGTPAPEATAGEDGAPPPPPGS